MHTFIFLLLVTACLLSNPCVAVESDKIFINGNPIICDREAYNCPSYKPKNSSKRLKNCKDVFTVWNTCPRDIHDLDRDKDGFPCEKNCRKK